MGVWVIVAIAVGLALVAFIAVCIYEQHHFKVTEYSVTGSRVPECLKGKRLLQLTDLHDSCYGRNNGRLLDAIDSLSSDAIVITGDMVTGSSVRDAVKAGELFRKLTEKHKVYYAIGNHEGLWEKFDSFDEYKTLLESYGVIFLMNTSCILEAGNGETVRLVGLKQPLPYYKKKLEAELIPMYEYLEEELGNTSLEEYTVLLAHDPYYFEAYSRWGADLVLSGHVHGGIIRLPFIGGLISPRYELFPKYDAGLYEKGRTKMILSRGMGSHTLPIRFMNLPEILLIRFE